MRHSISWKALPARVVLVALAATLVLSACNLAGSDRQTGAAAVATVTESEDETKPYEIWLPATREDCASVWNRGHYRRLIARSATRLWLDPGRDGSCRYTVAISDPPETEPVAWLRWTAGPTDQTVELVARRMETFELGPPEGFRLNAYVTWRGRLQLGKPPKRSPGSVASEQSSLAEQQCVDSWNVSEMTFFSNLLAGVRVDEQGVCRIIVNGPYRESAFQCWETTSAAIQCPSHAASLSALDPSLLTWNAHTGKKGEMRLDRPAAKSPIPPSSRYPMRHGYINPLDIDGQLRPGVRISESQEGSCFGGRTHRCFFDNSVVDPCFGATANLAVGDSVYCPEEAGSLRVLKLTLEKPLDAL